MKVNYLASHALRREKNHWRPGGRADLFAGDTQVWRQDGVWSLVHSLHCLAALHQYGYEWI
eukprot:5782601-Amphidinium_carterae.1